MSRGFASLVAILLAVALIALFVYVYLPSPGSPAAPTQQIKLIGEAQQLKASIEARSEKTLKDTGN